MKLRLPQRRAWRVAIYLGALLLVAVAVDLVVADARRSVRPGFMTTRIVQPRMADGSVDYAAALDQYFAQGVTPQDNAVIPLLQALGRQALATNQPPDAVTTALGMPPLPEAGEYFVAYGDFMRIQARPATREAVELELPQGFTYPAEVTPDVARWAKANDAALTKIVEATRRPRFYIPLFAGSRPLTLIETQLRHVKPLKEAGHALHARAIARLNEGDGAGFVADALALHRLARLLSQASTMVERIVGMSIETAAARLTQRAAQSGKLAPQQARQLIDGLEALGPVPTYVDTIDRSERNLGLDVVQALSKLPPTEAGRLLNKIDTRHTLPAWTFRFLPIPYERTMREMNQAYDGMIAAARQRNYPERMATLSLWSIEVDREVQGGGYLNLLSADWAISLLLPMLQKATTTLESARMEYNLARVALSLAAFKAERGAYPATLAELSPAYLREVPIDTFFEKPLSYARTANGYTLRSAGPNMKDEGGAGDDLAIETRPANATTETSSTGPARS